MTLTLSRLVVPVALSFNDDVHLAEQLVDAAGDLVRPDGELVLLFVHNSRLPVLTLDTGFAPPTYYATLADLQASDRAQAEKTLATLVTRVEQRGRKARAVVVDGVEGTGEAIVHAAERERADAIVVWSHGRRGLKRVFLGSVAERVAHLATLPLVILRSPPTA